MSGSLFYKGPPTLDGKLLILRGQNRNSVILSTKAMKYSVESRRYSIVVKNCGEDGMAKSRAGLTTSVLQADVSSSSIAVNLLETLSHCSSVEGNLYDKRVTA